MKLAILAEKPAVLRNYIRAATDAYGRPDEVIAAWIHPFANLWPNFSFPRGLRLADYPLARDPTFKQIDLDGWHSVNRQRWMKCLPNDDGTFGATHEEIRTENPPAFKRESLVDTAEQDFARHFREADEILVLSDRGAVYALCEQMALGAMIREGHRDPRVTAALPYAPNYAPDQHLGSLAEQIKRRQRHDQVRSDEAAQGRVALRFDYNYAMNAHVILRPLQIEAGMEANSATLSKAALQTLYALAKGGERPLRESEIVGYMSKYRGTGRYTQIPRHVGLGTAASRSTIVRTLIQNGLLDQVEPTSQSNDGKWPCYRPSGLAHKLLELLHPDCEDPDLPFRIFAWKQLPEAEANDKMDRYIRTFFGKLSRFAQAKNRHKAKVAALS